MNKSDFLYAARYHTYCRLKPSTVCDGIGVFAIKKLPKGFYPFSGCYNKCLKLHKDVIELLPDEEVKKYIKDLSGFEKDHYWVPRCGMNAVDMSFFINHSITPNIYENNGIFRTTRDIEIGEELTVDYRTYNDEIGF